MTTTDDRHLPSPEFVAKLEQEVLQACRDASGGRGITPLRPRWHERMRIAAMITIGIAFGVGAQLASAQVREAKEAVEVSRAIEVERDLASYRLELARREVDRLRAARASGVVSEQSLKEALLAQREVEIALAKRNLDIAEVRASKAAPRDELWAPLVDKRDYVRERLLAQAALVEERLKNAEVEEVTVERKVRAGTELVGALKEAQARVADTESELRLLAMKSKLREEFLIEKLAPVEVSRRVQRVEVELELARAERLLELAKARSAAIEEQVKSGMATVYEQKRVELDVLERKAEVQRKILEKKRVRPEEL